MNREQVSPGIFRITLNRRKNGRQDIIYEVLVDGAKIAGKRKRIRTRCKEADKKQPLTTYKMAQEERARLLHEVAIGTHVIRRKTTVEQACAAYIESKSHLKPNSLKSYCDWLKPLRSELGHIELQDIKKADIDALIRRLKAGTVPEHGVWKNVTINKMIKRFKAVLEIERKQKHVYDNVMELVDILPDDSARFEILSKDEMDKILAYPDPDRHAWALNIRSGLREGEIVGLKWKYVDFKNRTITIAETRETAGKLVYESTPKSYASNRVLPMVDVVYDYLLEAYGRVESEYVVCNAKGEPLSGSALWHRWMRMLQKLDIPHRRFHDGRHSFGSLLSSLGTPVADISGYLGHGSSAFTAKTYLHHTNEGLVRAAALLSGTEPAPNPPAGTLDGTQSATEHQKIA